MAGATPGVVRTGSLSTIEPFLYSRTCHHHFQESSSCPSLLVLSEMGADGSVRVHFLPLWTPERFIISELEPLNER